MAAAVATRTILAHRNNLDFPGVRELGEQIVRFRRR